MSEISNPIIFYPAVFVLILGAILMIKFKNIFYSLLSAIVVFFVAGFLFYILGSEYNAVIQIAIYGVAVPILLGLSIMFTENSNNVDTGTLLNLKAKVGLLFLSVVFVLTVLVLLSFSSFNIVDFEKVNTYNTLSAFSEGIFVKYVWAFELVSIILTLVIIGLTMFCNKKEDEECLK